jgi:hypothetical protein
MAAFWYSWWYGAIARELPARPSWPHRAVNRISVDGTPIRLPHQAVTSGMMGDSGAE